MTLHPESRLVRWTYFPNKLFRYPKHTTLCRFFWRAFVLMPLCWVLIGIFITGFGIAIWEHLTTFSLAFVCILATIGLSGGLCALIHTDWGTVTINSVKESTLFQGLKTVKGRFCPIIHITP